MGKNIIQPEKFLTESTTLWDFPERGNWATHKPNYRGNFAPQVARNLILMYSQENELILDPMVGSGTTLIEAKLLHRNAIGFDINTNAIDISNDRLKFKFESGNEQVVEKGDVRNLYSIKDSSIDLIITHPPYFDLVKYSNGENPDDLSSQKNIPGFLYELRKGIVELFRVLKPNHYCAILIGDTRKGQHFIPLSHYVLQIFLQEGFVLKEEIIKTQHNTRKGHQWSPSAKRYKFYLIMHEHLFVFRKPVKDENLSRILFSTWEGFKKTLFT